MDYQALTTTIVAGVLALGMIISVTVLLVAGRPVPPEFVPALLMLVGVAVGSAQRANNN